LGSFGETVGLLMGRLRTLIFFVVGGGAFGIEMDGTLYILNGRFGARMTGRIVAID
jgi:NADH dehydrogenase FAD-containing subunit